MALKLYVSAVVAAAAAVGALATWHVPDPGGVPVAVSALLVAMVAFAEALQVRYYHSTRHVDAHNLLEAMLAPLVFIGGGLRVTVVTAVGIALASLLRRNSPVKAMFNVAQWVFAAAIGEIVFTELSRRTESGSIIALLAAMLVISTANQLVVSGVLTIATGSPFGERGRTGSVPVALQGHLLSVSMNLVVGICLTAGYRWNRAVLLVGLVFIAMAYAAGRANASVYSDHVRLEALQRATHALTTSLDEARALPVFLAEARIGFEVSAVELVLFADGTTTVHRCTGPVPTGHTCTTGPHPLAQSLAASVQEPTRITRDAGPVGAALEAAGFQRAVAVPLLAGASTIGMLLLYDRAGMEGFEAGELSIAAALGRELVSFLERVELVSAIDEERRKLADIVESTSDGILTIDADGTVTSWNAGLVEITGYRADEMVGTRHFGLLRARDGAGRDVLVERWVDAWREGAEPDLPGELQVLGSSGETIWLSCSYSRIPAAEGRRDVLVVVARNITQARELERLKDDFVAVVSHELRTPLVPIKGWAQTLINRGDRLSEDQRRTAVQSILAQAQKLESLVLNILESSRIEAGRVDADGVADVAAVTMRVVEDALSARPDRSIRVRPPSVPCHVRGSAVWVERAVSNLVANALKYSADDEPVDIAVGVERDDILVTVTDRGPGIPLESQERIFERFERLEETRTQTGTGLGLYITRRLARAMGGDVRVSSVPGAGSTFLLRLPAAPVTPRLPEQRVSEQVDRDPPNVVHLL